VVHEAGQVALGAGVDYAVLLDGHEVEVVDVVVVGPLDAPLALLVVDELAHVLVDELACFDVLQGPQAAATAVARLDHFLLRVLAPHEALIGAARASCA